MKPLIEERFAAYFAPDGLMKLTPDNERDSYYLPPTKGWNCLRTADNDNGVLFLAQYAWLKYGYPGRDVPALDVAEILHRLSVKHMNVLTYGLYNRNPCRYDKPEAHDNYIGIVAIAYLAYRHEHLNDILYYGKRHLWVYDNVHPGKIFKDLSRMRLPSDIAFYKIAAKERPSMLQFIWLCGEIILNTYTMKKSNSSSILLKWLQFKVICEEHRQSESYDFLHERMLIILWKYLAPRWVDKYHSITERSEEMFEWYFKDENHPNRILARENGVF